MRRTFFTLDVFTRQRFAGNPLAVVTQAEGLDTATMQAIAREFALSETVFVLPPRERAHRARLRIFTPGSELPFAGHPTIGTAVLLAQLDGAPAETATSFIVEEGVGPVPCSVQLDADGVGDARFQVPRVAERAGEAAAVAAVAAALGLAVQDIGFPGHAPSIYSAGVPFAFVPVRDKDAVSRARPNMAAWDAGFSGAGGPGKAFIYARETVDAAASFHARMFAPSLGVAEDPATGGAVAALAGVIAAFDAPGDGRHSYLIEQGFAMGRPSHIRLEIEMRQAALVAAAIGGAAVRMTEGTIEA